MSIKNLLENRNLAKYSNFRVGGNADYLFIPKTKEELISFLKKLNKTKNIQPITVIGAGSNILIRDGGIRGIVIITKELNNVEIKKTRIVAECGALNSKFFNRVREKEISGYEFLACIPGTIGGACKMNAGCYGSEVSDYLISIKTIDFNGKIKTYNIDECNMEYRKNNLPDNLIFLEATFKINKKKDKKEIDENFRNMINKKIETQPVNAKTCGSTFKNLSNLPAWKIIKEIGLQGVDFGGANFSAKHANFLVNEGTKSSKDLENAIDTAIEKAKKELSIVLELEIKILGDK